MHDNVWKLVEPLLDGNKPYEVRVEACKQLMTLIGYYPIEKISLVVLKKVVEIVVDGHEGQELLVAHACKILTHVSSTKTGFGKLREVLEDDLMSDLFHSLVIFGRTLTYYGFNASCALQNLSHHNPHETVVSIASVLPTIIQEAVYNIAVDQSIQLAPFLQNFCATAEGRRLTKDAKESTGIFPLCFQGGCEKSIFSITENFCIDTEYHDWLLFEAAVLPLLLLPITGNEPIDLDELDKMPCDIQFRMPDKQRNRDPAVRCLVLKCLKHLCQSEVGRTYLHEKNCYRILQIYHLWEQDENNKDLCEEIVDVLLELRLASE